MRVTVEIDGAVGMADNKGAVGADDLVTAFIGAAQAAGFQHDSIMQCMAGEVEQWDEERSKDDE